MSMDINCEPTPQGYRQIATTFRSEIISHAKKGKSQTTTLMLRSMIETAVYLSHKFPEEYQKLMNPLTFK